MSDDKPGFSLDRIMTMCPACGDGQRFFLMRSEVGKLVRAAQELVDAADQSAAFVAHVHNDRVDALIKALKPFEGP